MTTDQIMRELKKAKTRSKLNTLGITFWGSVCLGHFFGWW